MTEFAMDGKMHPCNRFCGGVEEERERGERERERQRERERVGDTGGVRQSLWLLMGRRLLLWRKARFAVVESLMRAVNEASMGSFSRDRCK